jgi:predicted nucleic acid-binding protein
MSEYQRIYLDANIVIDMVEAVSETGDLLRSFATLHPVDHPTFFRTSELTLSEVLVHPLRRGNSEIASIYVKMLAGEYWLTVSTVSTTVLEAASVLRASHGSLKLPDAIHIATAMLSDCSHFLTQDQRITDFQSSKHPFREQVLPDLKVIRPAPATLSSILEALQ